MWSILAWLAGSKIGRVILGIGIIAFFFFGFRMWLVWHDTSVARAARSGYVLLSEKTAAEAKATEMERQRNAASQALDEHRKRLAAAEASEQKAKDTLETEIKAYELQLSEKNRACLIDDADRLFLQHH